MDPAKPDMSDTRPRILIVEDDAVARQGLVQLLEPRGFRTAVARTLREGLAQLGWRPDFLILDLCLSDGRGTVLLRQVRAERLATRVAVTTGTVDECLVAAALVLRPDRLFRKPYSTVDLLSWLQLEADPAGGTMVDRIVSPLPVARPYDVMP